MSRSAKFLIVVVALLLVGGGSATAAKLITGKQVKNASLTGADLKNGSVGTADLSRAARKRISGARGPTGPAGTPGAAGATGATGPAGPQGPAGTPDGYTRVEADGRYLEAATAPAGHRVQPANGSDATLLEIPGVGRLTTTCAALPGAKTVQFRNTSGAEMSYMRSATLATGTIAFIRGSILPGGNAGFGGADADYSMTIHLHGATPVVVSLIAIDDNASECEFSAQVTPAG